MVEAKEAMILGTTGYINIKSLVLLNFTNTWIMN